MQLIILTRQLRLASRQPAALLLPESSRAVKIMIILVAAGSLVVHQKSFIRYIFTFFPLRAQDVIEDVIVRANYNPISSSIAQSVERVVSTTI